MQSWLDRVRSKQADGRAMFSGEKEIPTKQMPAISEFVAHFYDEVFM